MWQWNHIPVDGEWSLTQRPGYLRLRALDAEDLWHARNTLTQRAVGPRSTVTAVLETQRMEPGDIAGLALFNRPYAWLGVARSAAGFRLTMFDEVTGNTVHVRVEHTRIWLRAECDFLTNEAAFSYSTDGTRYMPVGERHRMAYGLITFQGVRYSLFAYHSGASGEGGFADFDKIAVEEERPSVIPHGKRIVLSVKSGDGRLTLGDAEGFDVIDMGLGRVALRGDRGVLSVSGMGQVSLLEGEPGPAQAFQWMETFDGDLLLMSLTTHRFLRIDPDSGRLAADSPGPHPNGQDGVRWLWTLR